VRLLGLSTLGLMTLFVAVCSMWFCDPSGAWAAAPIKSLAESFERGGPRNLAHRVDTVGD